MAYANPSAIKTAIDNGATYSSGFIVDGGVSKLCVLANGQWTLDANAGVRLFNMAHFNAMKNAAVIYEASEYRYCFETPAGKQQLQEVDGYAKLIDP